MFSDSIELLTIKAKLIVIKAKLIVIKVRLIVIKARLIVIRINLAVIKIVLIKMVSKVISINRRESNNVANANRRASRSRK